MKEIKAIIRPNKLTMLRDRLRDIQGFPGMTVSRAEGCSAPSRHSPASHKEELTDYTPKIRIEIVCPDELADAVVDRITQVAQTGHIGDGLVWVTEITRAVFIHKTLTSGEN